MAMNNIIEMLRDKQKYIHDLEDDNCDLACENNRLESAIHDYETEVKALKIRIRFLEGQGYD